MQLENLVFIAPPILLALTFHEYSHAYVAHRLGDDTAQKDGRLTLNPLRHLDPLGTIMIFLVQFGWAKPVPVNPYNLRSPKRDLLWISAAGPISNMSLALASGLLFRLLSDGVPVAGRNPALGMVVLMVFLSLKINLALAVFNLLPIAPLDGSKILFGLLPPHYGPFIFALERYGPFILIGLIIVGQTTGISILGGLIWPFVDFFSYLFAGI
jgi:Zn-dependent protease